MALDNSLRGAELVFLESSLIGVLEVKLLLPLSPCRRLVSRTRGLLASLRGRRVGCRMMGSEEQGIPICLTTFGAHALRFQTLNEIALPIVPTGTIPSADADS